MLLIHAAKTSDSVDALFRFGAGIGRGVVSLAQYATAYSCGLARRSTRFRSALNPSLGLRQNRWASTPFSNATGFRDDPDAADGEHWRAGGNTYLTA